jgi:hypothetical protein
MTQAFHTAPALWEPQCVGFSVPTGTGVREEGSVELEEAGRSWAPFHLPLSRSLHYGTTSASLMWNVAPAALETLSPNSPATRSPGALTPNHRLPRFITSKAQLLQAPCMHDEGRTSQPSIQDPRGDPSCKSCPCSFPSPLGSSPTAQGSGKKEKPCHYQREPEEARADVGVIPQAAETWGDWSHTGRGSLGDTQGKDLPSPCLAFGGGRPSWHSWACSCITPLFLYLCYHFFPVCLHLYLHLVFLGSSRI